MPMMYRSPWTRAVLAFTAIVGGVIFTFGDAAKWRSTPSLHWLTRIPVPLQTWGVLAIVYGLLLLFERTRPAGYAAGAFLFSLFAVSLLATSGGDTPKNVWAIIALIDVVPFHLLSIRTAEAAKLTHRAGPL